MPKENIAINPKKIGLFGGTFDPIHEGHLSLATLAMQSLNLDVIFFIPNYQSPFKQGTPPASMGQRLHMLELALAPYPDFLVSLVETSPKTHYTIDTVKYFQKSYPTSLLFFLAGDDVLATLSQWKSFSSLIGRLQFLIFSRTPKTLPFPSDLLPYKNRFICTNLPPNPVSSSEIRSEIAQFPDMEILSVPPKVSDYIRSMKLYQEK